MPELAHKKRANRAKDRLADPEKWKRRYREHNLRHNFGLSIEQYDQMLEDQNGLCAICESHHSNFKTRLAVDHNHQTGKIRGLLCSECNNGIGKLHDDVDYLMSAVLYLNRTNA